MARKQTIHPSSGNGAKSLYPNGANRIGKSRPTFTFTQATDIAKVQTTYTRAQQISGARRLYATCPDLGGAINAKAEWVAGPGTFVPRFTGEDRKWGDIVNDWAMQEYYPNLCINGPNYNLNKLLEVSSIALDVDGDTGIYFTYSREGLPRIGMLPSHRIGNRANQEKVTQKGKYEGYTIYDGVVVNGAGIPVAIQVLGTDESKDVIKPYGQFDLLFDAEWQDQYRGISRVARARYDWEDRDDIDEYIKRYIKLAASVGMKYKSADGTAHDSAFTDIPSTSETSETSEIQTGVNVTSVNGGDILFFSSKDGEDIEMMENKNPSPEVEAVMKRITGRALFSVGWQPELIYPSGLAGAAARQIQDQTRKIIRKRQMILERRARKILLFGIATAMELGIIPKKTTKDWMSWSFSTGNQLTIDGGNEAKADVENIKLGLDTYSNVCAKQGRDYYDVFTQTKVEGVEMVKLAEEMAKETGKSFDFCFGWMTQRTPNGNSVSTAPPQEEKPEDKPQEEPEKE
jgi:hypothetical protein